MCNDGSGDYVKVNAELCVGCGQCIEACTHGARSGLDDFEPFMADLSTGADIVAVVAPAAASNFDGRYLELNAWLSSLGVTALFDVSFGAELTVKSYLEHKAENDPNLIIAQPCPTLVTFIEIYRPELIQYLAPADSPMMHTIKMIKKFFPRYASSRIAVISPCYAKRREFDEVGLGDYNVTFKSLEDYIAKKGIELAHYPPRPYDGPAAERGVLFPTPGGLMRTVERHVPGISGLTRKIEGQPEVFDYLAHLSASIDKGSSPLQPLVDCLNCEMGCNAGPGTSNRGKHPDLIEGYVETRNHLARESFKKGLLVKTEKSVKRAMEKLVARYWQKGLYDRSYVDRSKSFRDAIRRPTDEEIRQVHIKTHKRGKRDILNCGACGYKSCEQMAVAICNGLNRPENCRHYVSVEVAMMHEDHRNEIKRTIDEVAKASVGKLKENMRGIDSLAGVSIDMAPASRVLSRSSRWFRILRPSRWPREEGGAVRRLRARPSRGWPGSGTLPLSCERSRASRKASSRQAPSSSRSRRKRTCSR
jgi:iron only hydrogenase large subunit-like protein